MLLDRETRKNFEFEDTELVAITWMNDGRDLQLDLELGGGRSARLICRWVRGVRINVELDADSGGTVMTSGGGFEQLEDGWRGTLDFASDGDITWRCLSAELLIAPLAQTRRPGSDPPTGSDPPGGSDP